MFTDIEGSTKGAMTERPGDRRGQEVLRTHNAIVRQQVAAIEGFEVKSQGDGFASWWYFPAPGGPWGAPSHVYLQSVGAGLGYSI